MLDSTNYFPHVLNFSSMGRPPHASLLVWADAAKDHDHLQPLQEKAQNFRISFLPDKASIDNINNHYN